MLAPLYHGCLRFRNQAMLKSGAYAPIGKTYLNFSILLSNEPDKTLNVIGWMRHGFSEQRISP